MAIITDATGRQLAQAVGGIDTGGLAKDTTLQATNTALGNINTTEQSIASAIVGLGQTLGNDKANISGDNIADKATFRTNIDANSSFSYYDETIGSNDLALPNNWKVLIAQVVYNSIYLTTIFTNGMMTTGGNGVSLGNYGTSYAIGRISKSAFKIVNVNWAGVDVTSSSKAYIYLAY